MFRNTTTTRKIGGTAHRQNVTVGHAGNSTHWSDSSMGGDGE